ncbi:hypothetical protein [Photobacterium sp. DNB22_13_2]
MFMPGNNDRYKVRPTLFAGVSVYVTVMERPDAFKLLCSLNIQTVIKAALKRDGCGKIYLLRLRESQSRLIVAL